MKRHILLYFIMVATVLFCSCKEETEPKPYAYFRIDLPTPKYVETDSLGPYTAEINAISCPEKPHAHWQTKEDTWMNVWYPRLNATIHLSHKHITPSQVQTVTEESRSLAYKHTIRADAIIETYYEDSINHVYGVMYTMTGNAASPAQFYMTDSAHNFLRGAVYFNNIPNYDSITPCAKYIENDVRHLIETLRWQNK